MKKSKIRTGASLAVIALIFLGGWLAEHLGGSNSMLVTVLQKGAVYALIAVSMNLLNGFTGLFSLGQAGFMLAGAYTYAVLTIPMAKRAAVYQYYDGGWIQMTLHFLPAMIAAGLVAALFAALIGIPVLRLRGDYLAIATLGFAEIIRAIVQWDAIGPLTNGSNLLKTYPTVGLILLLINSTYGRAFKAIRDDEIAAEAMGINLFHHKQMAFVISSFFAGVGGALLAMYQGSLQANSFKSSMTYEILLIVVIGGLGSVSGSIMASFLFIACSEWWLRFLDSQTFIGDFQVPLLSPGFRMVVFSVVIMVIVLFFRRGIMGDRELWEIGARRGARKGGRGK